MTNEKEIEKILHKKDILHESINFTWEQHSQFVAEYCPQLINPEKFNWKDSSYSVVRFCPKHFNTNLYDWEYSSRYVAMYAPELIDPRKYTWKTDSHYLAFYQPNHKYIGYCVWNELTLGCLDSMITIQGHPVWGKYRNQIKDLETLKKGKILLAKISKEITLRKL